MLDYMPTRLDLLAPDLGNQIKRLDPAAQRLLACELMRWAVRRTPVDDPRFATGYAALLAGTYGDEAVMAVARTVEVELDEKYLDLLPNADTDEEHDHRFCAATSQAFDEVRVAGALVAALGDDPLEAACETLYEVQATFDGQPELTDLQTHLSQINLRELDATHQGASRG